VSDNAKKKILIIDDDIEVLRQLSKFFSKEGYQTSTAESGLAGLEIFKRETPDIALVDIMLPEMDGIEILKEIKKTTAKTEVIIITGYGRTETAIEALKFGAFGYIQKPLDFDELGFELANALEKQEKAQELDKHVKRLETLVNELREALDEIKTLRGIIPICSHCKQVRDDKGLWNKIEEYIRDHSEAVFSHGVCPDCAEKHYPEMNLYDFDKKE